MMSGRIQDLFHAAADLPSSARARYLDGACDGDPALRTAVERLLAADESAGPADADDGWLTSPAAVLDAGGGAGTAADDGADVPAYVGTYRVVRVIGRGGSGIVYEAEQRHPRRAVAVKVLRSGLASAGQLDRLAREADLLGRLRHPGIAQVYEAGVAAGGHPYLAMEHVAERTLTAHADDAALSTADRVRLLADVCDAVHHAHGQQIVHLDLKPANILVDADGRPKVLDFGIARLTGTASAPPAGTARLPVGTPAYMSPEQLDGRPDVDRRADVYALGVILAELLGGRVVSGGRPPEFPTAGVPRRHRRDLRAIVARATAAAPDDRYATAAALGTDVRRCLSGHPVTARPPRVGYRGRRFLRRHPALAVGTVTTAAVLLAATVVSVALAVHAAGQRRRAEHNLYVADVQLARDAVDAGRPDDAARLLGEAVGPDGLPAVRGWEWDFLNRLAHPAVRVVGHMGRGDVRAVAVSPDGRLVAAAGAERTIHVWSPDPPVERLVLRGHTDQVFGLAFSPTGDRLVSGGLDGRILAWNPTTGQELPSPPPRAMPVFAVAFGPGGRWYAVAAQRRTVAVYEAATGRLLVEREMEHDWCTDVAVSRTGDRVVLQAGGGQATVFRVGDRDGDGLPDALADPVVCPGHFGWTSAVALSPDGQLAASAGDGLAWVWDTTTGDDRQVIRAHDGCVLDVAFSADGRELATSGRDGLIRTWSVADGRPLKRFAGHGDWVHAVCWTPDGRLVTGGKEGGVRLWQTGPADGTEAVRLPLPAASSAVVYHPDGRRLAVAGNDGRVRVWDDGVGGAPRDLPGPFDWAMAVATSPDGRWLAAGGRDGTVRVWPWAADDPQPAVTFKAHGGWVQALAFSRDSARLVSGGRDRTLHVWDARTGAAVDSIDPRGTVTAVAHSPDGATLAWTTAGSSATLMDVADGRRVRLAGHTQSVNAVAFAPDGRTVATASDDQTVRLWTAASGRPGPVLRGHTNRVTAVAFTPDGRRVVSAGDDHVVRIWEAATGRQLTVARGPDRQVAGVAVSPADGRVLAVGDDFALFVWTGDH